MPTITTQRLLLRPLEPADTAAIATLIADWDVIRWLTRPPYPYTASDAAQFIAHVTSKAPSDPDLYFAVTQAGALIGVVNLDRRPRGMNLGYWIGKPYWGHGYMTEAATALAAHFFAIRRDPAIASGTLSGNEASAKVLRKLGFEETGRGTTYSGPMARDVPSVEMILTRARFKALHP
jgi:RimJ/RimL family protein N-acetyltransferase